MILDTLIFDGKVEQSFVAGGDAGQTKLYRAVNPLIQPSGLMRMPCGSCPVSSVFSSASSGITCTWGLFKGGGCLKLLIHIQKPHCRMPDNLQLG